jgi:hypothetical protein
MNLKAFWHDTVWSKVIAGIILTTLGTALGASSAYFMRPPSSDTRPDDAIGPSNPALGRCCDAVLSANVEPHGDETIAWFEWGKTPDLGTRTIAQRFTEDSKFYYQVFGLTENTTYYYRAVLMNRYGTAMLKVVSFNTARGRNGKFEDKRLSNE